MQPCNKEPSKKDSEASWVLNLLGRLVGGLPGWLAESVLYGFAVNQKLWRARQEAFHD